jgi:hypothetical protein
VLLLHYPIRPRNGTIVITYLDMITGKAVVVLVLVAAVSSFRSE